jgi:hypothetical protein
LVRHNIYGDPRGWSGHRGRFPLRPFPT